MKLVFRFWIVVVLMLVPSVSHAALDMFLKFEGEPTLEGESLDKAHSKWIEVLSFNHSMTVPPGALKATHSDLVITKFLDKSSPHLSLAVNTGKHVTKVIFEVVQPGTSPQRLYQLELTDVVVTSSSVGGSTGEDRLVETISLKYSAIKWTYYLQTGTGTVTPVSTTWDLGKSIQ